MITHPGCKVCNSDHRIEIEDALLRGRGYTAIWRSLPPTAQESLSIANIKSHYTSGHLPSDVSVTRVLTEKRAQEVGLILDEAEGSIADHVTLLQETVRRTFERIVTGQVLPEVQDGLAAARILTSLGVGDGGEIDMHVWSQALREMMLIAREVMDPEQFALYGQRLATSPVLHAIREKFQAAESRAALAS